MSETALHSRIRRELNGSSVWRSRHEGNRFRTSRLPIVKVHATTPRNLAATTTALTQPLLGPLALVGSGLRRMTDFATAWLAFGPKTG